MGKIGARGFSSVRPMQSSGMANFWMNKLQLALRANKSNIVRLLRWANKWLRCDSEKHLVERFHIDIPKTQTVAFKKDALACCLNVKS